MESVDSPEDQMSTIHCEPGTVLTLDLVHVRNFKERCREQYDALIECSAFVNHCRRDVGQLTVLALSFYG